MPLKSVRILFGRFGIVSSDSDRAAAERVKEFNPRFKLNASVARAEQDRQTSLGESDGWTGPRLCFDIVIYMCKRAPREHSFTLHNSIKKPLMPNVFFHHSFMPSVNLAIFWERFQTLSSSIVCMWTEILDSEFVC